MSIHELNELDAIINQYLSESSSRDRLSNGRTAFRYRFPWAMVSQKIATGNNPMLRCFTCEGCRAAARGDRASCTRVKRIYLRLRTTPADYLGEILG